MERDVNKRFSATEALQHQWLREKVPDKFDEKLANNAL
jgi:hypothetical protein